MTPVSACHLGVTHSPLVSRVFEAAMSQRGVPPDAVRWITRRGVSFPGSGRCLDDISDEMEDCYRRYDRAGFRAVWRRFDETLRALTGDRPFEAYVPHLNRILYQEIIRHPECAAYSFLEEGGTSSRWSTRYNARSSWSKILRSHIRTWRVGANYQFTRPMFDHGLPHYRAAYAISSLAFKGMPGRTDVSSHVPKLPAGRPPGNTYMILDAIHLVKGVRWEDYEDALMHVVSVNSLPPGDVLVKFHFAETDAGGRFDSIKRRLAALGGPSPRQLAPDFSVEENLTGMDLLLFGISSLGYYSSLAGARVGCFAGEIKGLSLADLIASGRVPADFPQVVGLESP